MCFWQMEQPTHMAKAFHNCRENFQDLYLSFTTNLMEALD